MFDSGWSLSVSPSLDSGSVAPFMEEVVWQEAARAQSGSNNESLINLDTVSDSYLIQGPVFPLRAAAKDVAGKSHIKEWDALFLVERSVGVPDSTDVPDVPTASDDGEFNFVVAEFQLPIFHFPPSLGVGWNGMFISSRVKHSAGWPWVGGVGHFIEIADLGHLVVGIDISPGVVRSIIGTGEITVGA